MIYIHKGQCFPKDAPNCPLLVCNDEFCEYYCNHPDFPKDSDGVSDANHLFKNCPLKKEELTIRLEIKK